MGKYCDGIERHAAEVSRLHARIHETFKERGKSDSKWETWSRACAEFHAHTSSVCDWLRQIEDCDDLGDWQDGRAFVFDYFDVDPMYFGSGYKKEMLVQKIKKFELSEREKDTIRILIVRRIQRGAMREFSYFCRLIPDIKTEDFQQEISRYANGNDRDAARRATYALRYFD